MATLQKKLKEATLQKILRGKTRGELSNNQSDINNSIDKQRKLKNELLIAKCKDAFTGLIDKNEELFDLAHKLKNRTPSVIKLDQWL